MTSRAAVGSLAAAVAVAAVAVAGVIVHARRSREPGPHAAATTMTAVPDVDLYSNTTPRDYVGPAACGTCHTARLEQWRRGLHASMNRLATDAGAVVGDFSGVRVDYAGGSATFAREGERGDGGGDDGEPVMTLVSAGGVTRRYRVTRTIGSRYLQEYVGVQLQGPEPPGDPRYTTEVRLPFGYWVRERAWFHQQYFDSWYGLETLRDGTPAVDAFDPGTAPWAGRCAWCHNTYPFELRMRRAVGQGNEQYFEPLTGARAAAPHEAADLLPVDELVTVGISCESCHLGGREHAADGRDIQFAPSGPGLVPKGDAPDLSGGRQNSVLVNTICAQCHSTPAPRFPDGAVARNSSEALDMASGACMPVIKCTDCHDPHATGPGAGAPVQAAHVQACVRCHDDLESAEAARAHSRHAGGAVSCLDCHMPKIVQGVSGFVRSHRISSPSVQTAGAPNACNLCHLDRSLAWTGRHLADWDAAAAPAPAPGSRAADRDLAAGRVWLASDDPKLRLLAAAAYARSPDRAAALPLLLAVLDDPVAYVRMWLLFSVEDTIGHPLDRAEYDPTAPPARRAGQAAALLRHPPRGRP